MNSYRKRTRTGAQRITFLWDKSTFMIIRYSKETLQLSHVKPMVVGHWGTSPGQNFIYVADSCRDQQLSAIVIMNNPYRVFEEYFKSRKRIGIS